MMFKPGDRVRFKKQNGTPHDWPHHHRYGWTVLWMKKMSDDDDCIFHLKRRHDGEIHTCCISEPENSLELA